MSQYQPLLGKVAVGKVLSSCLFSPKKHTLTATQSLVQAVVSVQPSHLSLRLSERTLLLIMFHRKLLPKMLRRLHASKG